MRRRSLTHVRARPAVRAAMAQNSTLDAAQLDAFAAALSEEVALIQGPPGTGKVPAAPALCAHAPHTPAPGAAQTYVGLCILRALLDNTAVEAGGGLPGVGPILCVCYTNHALDQFLEASSGAPVRCSGAPLRCAAARSLLQWRAAVLQWRSAAAVRGVEW